MGAALCLHAKVTANRSNNEAGEERFCEALNDVAVDQRAIGVMEIRGCVQTKKSHTDDRSTGNADGVRKNGEEKEHKDRSVKAWCHQFPYRIGPEGTHCIDLLCYLHGADLRGHSRCIAPGDHEARQHWAKLLYHRERNEIAGHTDCAELLEGRSRLQGQNATGEEAGKNDNREGAKADRIHLRKNIGPIARTGKDIGDCAPRQQRVVLKRGDLLLGEDLWRDEGHVVIRLTVSDAEPPLKIASSCQYEGTSSGDAFFAFRNEKIEAIMAEMTAAVLYGKQDLRLEQVAVPRPAAGELLLRIEAALTCGTDLKVYRRGYHARMLKPPIPFGHEMAGVVEEVGAGVTAFRKGDRVVALNSAPCDRCFFCTHGQQNLCEDLLFNNGAYAEYLRVPSRIVEKNTLLIPDDVLFEHAALTEPLACVVRGIEESGAKAGDTMVIIGAGSIGLMFMHVAELAGVNVIAVVKREDQIATAKSFGAAKVMQVNEESDIVAAVRALTPAGRGADIVIEAVAAPVTWEWAVDMVRKGGVVNFFGGPPSGTKVQFDTNRLHYGDITLKASFHHTPATCRTAFELVTSHRFRCAEYITERVDLKEIPAVFARMMNRNGGSREIKTAVFPAGVPK